MRGIGKQGQLALRLGQAASTLLGLHDEAAAAIEIYEAARLCPGMDKGDRALKPIVVCLSIGGRRLRRFNLKELGQLNGKLLKVGALTAAGRFPAGDEGFNVNHSVDSRIFGGFYNHCVGSRMPCTTATTKIPWS